MESSSSWSSLSILRSPIMGALTCNSFGTDGVIGDMAKPARVEQTWGQVSAQVVLVRLVASVVVTVSGDGFTPGSAAAVCKFFYSVEGNAWGSSGRRCPPPCPAPDSTVAWGPCTLGRGSDKPKSPEGLLPVAALPPPWVKKVRPSVRSSVLA